MSRKETAPDQNPHIPDSDNIAIFEQKTAFPELAEITPASVWRRLAAIFYDSFILFLIIFSGAQWFPLIPENYQTLWWVIYLKQLYVFSLAFLYFGWFWTHSGQTVGMRAWRIQVVAENGESISWPQALIRFIVAVFSWLALGIGFWVALFNRDKRCWHDVASRSWLRVLPKPC